MQVFELIYQAGPHGAPVPVRAEPVASQYVVWRGGEPVALRSGGQVIEAPPGKLMAGKKATVRTLREAGAKARDAATAQSLRELEERDPAAFQRALGMARYDLHITKGQHPAARKLLAIAQAEGMG